jgi:hypothetical protein
VAEWGSGGPSRCLNALCPAVRVCCGAASCAVAAIAQNHAQMMVRTGRDNYGCSFVRAEMWLEAYANSICLALSTAFVAGEVVIGVRARARDLVRAPPLRLLQYATTMTP